MEILLTNDDGIYAKGIQTLTKTLTEIDAYSVTVVAPDRERSASGHSITLNKPLRVDEEEFPGIPEAKFYKLDGTPADCVKIGAERFCNPDLIISGINHGPNLGFDVLYSGTVAAAVEGWMMGYSSFAISLKINKQHNFQTGARFMADFINTVKPVMKKENLLLNINIPDLEYQEIKGTSATTLGKNLYEDHFEERTDPAGRKYYWLTGAFNVDATEHSDIATVNRGMISVTPLQLKLTDTGQAKELNKLIQTR